MSYWQDLLVCIMVYWQDLLVCIEDYQFVFKGFYVQEKVEC